MTLRMTRFDRLGLAMLKRLDPERAHGLALAAVRLGLVPSPPKIALPRLRCKIAGLDLPNPVGLAAGLDKNAVALAGLARVGFGFIEAGAVTPRPQPGNPKPRLFRLEEEGAIINNFGFNSHGMEKVAPRLARFAGNAVVGLNLGANRDSRDLADYARVLTHCGAHVDFATVNVSCPNVDSMRALQQEEALLKVLERVMEARAALPRPIPIFLKISPDVGDSQLAAIAEIARQSGVAAIIATNTTKRRDGNLRAPHRDRPGGLSGRPLFAPSTRILAQLYQHTEGKIPLIGTGGVFSAADAYAKIRAGASAIQIYSALVYGGFAVLAQINRGLDASLAHDGLNSIAEAVGRDHEKFAEEPKLVFVSGGALPKPL